MNASTSPILSDSVYPRCSEALRDGSVVLIRPITRDDKFAEREFIEHLSQEARHFRFLGQVGTPSERTIEAFTDIDHVHDVGFAAVIQDGSHERFVGVSRYGTQADGLRCECAVTVSDAWQHKGLGTLLMKHLIEVARSHAVQTMFSIDSAENFAMKDLVKPLGFLTRVDPDDSMQEIHELTL